MTGIQLQIRFLVPDMVELIMERYGWDMLRSLDELYRSETFRKICNPACGLYYQSAVYNFWFFEQEMEAADNKQPTVN